MKDLTRRFLSDSDRQRIDKHIRQAEEKTNGEIVVMVVSASDHYPLADILGSAFFAVPIALILMPYTGGWLWVGTQNVWVFLGWFVGLFALFVMTIRRLNGLKRLFISSAEIEAEVKEAAVAEFYKQGLYRTRNETGILIYISVFERRVWVLADRGIDTQLPIDTWQGIVDMIVKGIKERCQADAICRAVDRAGLILETHFPAAADNPDELKGVIIGD